MKILKDETTYTVELTREELLSIAAVEGFVGGASVVRNTLSDMAKEIGDRFGLPRDQWEEAGEILGVIITGCIRTDTKRGENEEKEEVPL